MFREMRRIKCKLESETAEKILINGLYGILALDGENNYPYALPINYAYEGGKIYFHSAKDGHKIDAMKKNPKASFCVVGQHEVIAEEFTSYYTSAIAFGKIKFLEGEEKIFGLKKLAEKYSPNESVEHRDKEIFGKLNALVVPVLEIEHLTGKAARELVRGGKII